MNAPGDLAKDLARFWADVEGDTLLVHTDVARLNTPLPPAPRDVQLERLFDILRSAAGGRTLLLPTFNYDYPRTRVYDVRGDAGQVGVLNDYIRRRPGVVRTRTPIFNFAVVGGGWSPAANENPFSAESVFGECVRRKSELVLFGGTFAVTFLHRVEEIADVGYRYLKPFPGTIVDGDHRETVRFVYRVRPARGARLDYDWERLADDLRDRGLLRSAPLGRGRGLRCRADLVAADWAERLRADPFYLLTAESRRELEALQRRVGGRLTLENVEGRDAAPAENL